MTTTCKLPKPDIIRPGKADGQTVERFTGLSLGKFLSFVTARFNSKRTNNQLMDLDDHLLEDIGLTREELGFRRSSKRDLFRHIGW